MKIQNLLIAVMAFGAISNITPVSACDDGTSGAQQEEDSDQKHQSSWKKYTAIGVSSVVITGAAAAGVYYYIDPEGARQTAQNVADWGKATNQKAAEIIKDRAEKVASHTSNVWHNTVDKVGDAGNYLKNTSAYQAASASVAGVFNSLKSYFVSDSQQETNTESCNIQTAENIVSAYEDAQQDINSDATVPQSGDGDNCVVPASEQLDNDVNVYEQ